MNKKPAIIFVSLLIVLIITVASLGVYLFLGKKEPVSHQTPAIQKDYVNSTFGYSFKLPDQYKMQSQNATPSAQPQTSDLSCLTLKNGDKCIILFAAYTNTTKEDTNHFLGNLPSFFQPLNVKKTKVGDYDVATWEADSLNYLFLNQNVVLRVSVNKPDLQLANQIMTTLKFKN